MDDRLQFDIATIRADDYPVNLTVKTYRTIVMGEIQDALANKQFWPFPDYFTTENYDSRIDLRENLESIARDRQFKVFGWLNANRNGDSIAYFGDADASAKRIYDLMDAYGRACWSAGEKPARRIELVDAFCDRLRNDLTKWGTWKTIKTDIMASVDDAHSVVHAEWNNVYKVKA
jgi:hypothetical protein